MTDTYHYAKVEKHELHQVWLEIEPLIKKATDTARGECDPEHFRRMVTDGKMDVFVAIDDQGVGAVMLTQFVFHPNYTALRVAVMGGRTPDILRVCVEEYWPRLIEWSKGYGAHTWEAFCHPGMARLLRKYGFNESYSLCVKRIKGE